MKKNLIVLISFLLAATVLISGCAQRGRKEKTRIRYMGAAHPEYNRIRVLQGKGFELFHSGVEISYETAPAGSYNSKLLTQLAGRTAPDVFIVFSPFTMVEYAQRGTLLDLAPFLEKDKDFEIDEIHPSLSKDYTYQGKIYAIPGGCNVVVLYYNKRLFDEAGVDYPDETWTWETVIEEAQKLTTKGEAGRVQQFGVFFGGEWRNYIKMNGGNIWNEDKTRCTINSHESREAIQLLKDLSVKYHVSPTASQIKEQGPFEMFMSNRLAMFIGARWYTTMLKKQKDLDWRIAPLPKPSEDKERLTPLTGHAWAVSSETKYPQLAYELVKHITSEEGIKLLIEIGDALPMRKNSKSWEILLKDPGRPLGDNRIYVDAMVCTFSSRDFGNPKTPFLEQAHIMKNEIDRFIYRNISAEEALKAIEKRLNARITEEK